MSNQYWRRDEEPGLEKDALMDNGTFYKTVTLYAGWEKDTSITKVQLRISPRTLQTLRDRRLIGYSQINRRFYYKPEEVKRLIPLVGTLYPHGR